MATSAWSLPSADMSNYTMSVGLVWGVLIVLALIVLLVLTIVYGIKSSSSFEGLSSDPRDLKMLYRINSGGASRFHGELSDYSQPALHMPRHADDEVHAVVNSSYRRGGKRERFAGAWSDAGPGHYGPNLGAQAAAYQAAQAQKDETTQQWVPAEGTDGSEALLSRPYAQSYHASQAPASRRLRAQAPISTVSEQSLNSHLLSGQ